MGYLYDQELAKNNAGISQVWLTNTIEILKEQKSLIDEIHGMKLDERTKSLCKAYFEANYIKHRATQMVLVAAKATTMVPIVVQVISPFFSSASASIRSLSSSSSQSLQYVNV